MSSAWMSLAWWAFGLVVDVDAVGLVVGLDGVSLGEGIFSAGWSCLRVLNGMNISNGMMVMPLGKMVMHVGTIGYAFVVGL